MWFRLRRAIVTYERHTRALRVPVGDTGRQVLRTCPWTLLQTSCQCSGKRRRHCWEDVVQSEREVTVGAQSQVFSTVSTVSRCTRQLWTTTCPQRHRWPKRLVNNLLFSSQEFSHEGEFSTGETTFWHFMKRVHGQKRLRTTVVDLLKTEATTRNVASNNGRPNNGPITQWIAWGWAWPARWPIRPILGFLGSKVHKNLWFPALNVDEPLSKMWCR